MESIVYQMYLSSHELLLYYFPEHSSLFSSPLPLISSVSSSLSVLSLLHLVSFLSHLHHYLTLSGALSPSSLSSTLFKQTDHNLYSTRGQHYQPTPSSNNNGNNSIDNGSGIIGIYKSLKWMLGMDVKEANQILVQGYLYCLYGGTKMVITDSPRATLHSIQLAIGDIDTQSSSYYNDNTNNDNLPNNQTILNINLSDNPNLLSKSYQNNNNNNNNPNINSSSSSSIIIPQ